MGPFWIHGIKIYIYTGTDRCSLLRRPSDVAVSTAVSPRRIETLACEESCIALPRPSSGMAKSWMVRGTQACLGPTTDSVALLASFTQLIAQRQAARRVLKWDSPSPPEAPVVPVPGFAASPLEEALTLGAERLPNALVLREGPSSPRVSEAWQEVCCDMVRDRSPSAPV